MTLIVSNFLTHLYLGLVSRWDRYRGCHVALESLIYH